MRPAKTIRLRGGGERRAHQQDAGPRRLGRRRIEDGVS